ncbi:MAG: efflux transporter periplasmic adaptor subunit [Acidocella sp. 20-57-95]|nr:MAG: efflux transporter periplasmic adaptor subunit [Acidocella sp. 20-57-95]OYV60819.1 MAG: efflux transporter periplasmic adaptor subunit [Acidocella sp. 21-58-7]HQT64452.1 efflux RND transporter periplasmic adaptor subunit [Acidocella sp.]HQU04613.1 efflux RND transporter periplasmic adaptor subunit [Acidocella sp.]
MIKRLIIMLVLVAVVLGGVFGFGAFKGIMIGKFLATLANPPQTVATITAAETAWQPSMNAIGSVVAINGANVSAEIAGIVDSVNFKSGDNVPKGALLVTLRPNNDNAVLAQLQATAKLDGINYQRDLKQFQADAVSQAQVDTDRATFEAAQAQVAAQQALIEEKQIRAPFAGTLGIRQVDVGQYLTAGTQIVTLQQLNPLYVDFYVPQQALAQISVGQPVTATVDAFPGVTFTGTIESINAAVDTTTRTIQVRATISNDGLKLRPGMFASVDIGVGQPQNFITLPQTAITYNPYGDTVYVVVSGKDANGKDTLTAKQQFVEVGATRGDQIAITKGLNVGDVVVTAGQLKLHQGAVVVINNSIQMSDDPHPNPPNE